jgi:hypothetical protein
MYLPSGRVNGHSLASAIFTDALVESNRRVVVERLNDWWIIASDHDWIGPAAKDHFERIVPFPEAGPNSMRSEVLLTAFADDVIVFDAVSHCIIKGDAKATEPLIALRKQHPEWKRIVAFRLAE